MFPPTFYFSVSSGSVLLHSRNPKKVAILPFDAITGEKLFCLSPVDKATLDSRFLAYQLQSDHFHEFVGRWLSGSVNKFLNWTALERYEFALPPIEEQRRVVALLSASSATVEAIQVALERAESLLDAMSQEAFAGAPGYVRLADKVVVTLGRQRHPKYASGEYMTPYIRAANVKDGRLELGSVYEMNFDPEERETYSLLDGDVLVSEGCGNIDEVGANAVWRGQIDGVVCFQKALIRLRSTSDSDPAFLRHWARFAFRSGLFKSIARGTSIWHVSAERTCELPFPALDVDQQRVHGARLDEMAAALDHVRSHLSDAAALAHTLLSQMMKGVQHVH
jgi:hypothetical protein